MVTVSVNQADQVPVSSGLIDGAVRAVLDAEHVGHADIAITFLKDAPIRELNKRYLDRDRPTDVLSFALDAGPGVTEEAVSGDVYIGSDRAVAQALERGIAPSDEAVRLAVHGTLHVLGHDHPEHARDESPFFLLQEELVDRVLQDPSLEVQR